MKKWSLIRIERFHDYITITSTDDIDLFDWLQKHFPKMEIKNDESYSNFGCYRYYLKSLDVSIESFWAIVKYLCEFGWEPMDSDTDGAGFILAYDFRRLSS